MKLYDFDAMFDKKLSEYMEKNAGKYTEKQWEDIIPGLYKKFGDTKISALNCSPNAYYAAMGDAALVKTLCAHLKQGVPVSEYLCNAIESRNAPGLLLPLLDGSEDEKEYALNLIGSAEEALPKLMSMLCDPSSSEDIKNRCVDLVKEKADVVAAEAKRNYHSGTEKEYMLEILSRTVVKDDEVYNILINEFRSDPENVPMHAGYLAAYGDERALPVLLDKIDEDGITFVEYQELKFAIESLGGVYEKERDFSNDPYYQLIKSHSVSIADIFDNLN